jgi:hypothetical protein
MEQVRMTRFDLKEHICGKCVCESKEELPRVNLLPQVKGHHICLFIPFQCSNLLRKLGILKQWLLRVINTYSHEPFTG